MGNTSKPGSFCPKMIQSRQSLNPFLKISDIIYDLLSEAILSSSIEPGSRLNVASIAESFGVSSTPVCAAIERLVDSGLVTAVRSGERGYRNYHVFDLSDDSVSDLFAARTAIESAAAAICAQKTALLDMEELWRISNGFLTAWQEFAHDPKNAPDVSERAKIDREFHSLLVMSTKNKYLIDMFESIQSTVSYLSIRTCRFVAAEQKADDFLIMATHHNTICRAIEAGLPEIASSAMDRHLDFCKLRCLVNRASSMHA